MAEPQSPQSTSRASRRRRSTSALAVDLAAWHAALASANLLRSVQGTAVQVVAHLAKAGDTKTTRRKLSAALKISERTLARHLPLLETAGLLRVTQHHDPKTGWHTDSTYLATLPEANDGAVTEAILQKHVAPSCMPHYAQNGTEASVPPVAEHLAYHGREKPLSRAPSGCETADAIVAVATATDCAGAAAVVDIRPRSWGLDLLAVKARLRRHPTPHDGDDGGSPWPPPNWQSLDQCYVPHSVGGAL